MRGQKRLEREALSPSRRRAAECGFAGEPSSGRSGRALFRGRVFSLAEIRRRIRRMIRSRFAGRLTVSDADDVMQEAMWRACLRHARFDRSKGSFATWLFGIALNVAREMARGVGPSVDLLGGADVDVLSPDVGAASAAGVVDGDEPVQERSRALNEALSRLTAAQRIAIQRHFGIGGPVVPDEDVSRELNVQASTVRKLRSRALARLRCDETLAAAVDWRRALLAGGGHESPTRREFCHTQVNISIGRRIHEPFILEPVSRCGTADLLLRRYRPSSCRRAPQH